jgi:hypothetical protein
MYIEAPRNTSKQYMTWYINYIFKFSFLKYTNNAINFYDYVTSEIWKQMSMQE